MTWIQLFDSNSHTASILPSIVVLFCSHSYSGRLHRESSESTTISHQYSGIIREEVREGLKKISSINSVPGKKLAISKKVLKQ